MTTTKRSLQRHGRIGVRGQMTQVPKKLRRKMLGPDAGNAGQKEKAHARNRAKAKRQKAARKRNR